MHGILIGGQQTQSMPDADLGQQGVDDANLHTSSTAHIAKFCSGGVILPVWRDQRQGRESFDDLRMRLRAGKALQQFLHHQSSGDDHFTFQSAELSFHAIHVDS